MDPTSTDGKNPWAQAAARAFWAGKDKEQRARIMSRRRKKGAARKRREARRKARNNLA